VQQEEKWNRKKDGSAKEESANLQIILSSEKSHMNLNASDAFFVNANIQALLELNEEESRTPMDICCVLDNSGSMQGEKWENVKEALNYIRRRLSPDDRLSITIFNSYDTIIHGLIKMTDENKAKSTRLLSDIDADGGTDIFSGLQSAFGVLERRTTKNSASCVFLLTDGQDSQRLTEKVALCNTMRSKGYSLFCFGFGADHDGEQMSAIARAAEGSFTYVAKAEEITDAFGGALGGQQSLAATNVRFTLTLPSVMGSAPTLLETFAGHYKTQNSAEGQSVTVSFANLFAGEQRDVLLKLRIPPCDTPGTTCLLKASASYTNNLGDRNDVTETEFCTVERVADQDLPPNDVVVNLKVDAQRIRISSTTAISSAISLADQCDFKAARQCLEAALLVATQSPATVKGDLACMSAVEDLEESLRKVQSESEYSAQGGKHQMLESMSQMSMQRCVHSKSLKMASPYQNARSKESQSEAFLSKNVTK